MKSSPGALPPIELHLRRPASALRDPLLGLQLFDQLCARSAVVIRGGGRLSLPEIGAIADSVFARQPAYDTKEHPELDVSSGLYAPVKFAPEEELLWHHEDTFNETWPEYIMFCSATVPEWGGETSIVDGRLVLDSMSRDVVDVLREFGITYERHVDGRAGRTWQQLYGTSKKEKAIAHALSRNEKLSFVTADSAVLTAHRPAFKRVGEKESWFNQLLHWHYAALPKDIRKLVEQGHIPIYRFCRYGNGGEIDPRSVEQLVEAHRDVEHVVRWAPGDMVFLNNAVMSHGRRPYRGKREHVVRLAGVGRSH
ncbi:TauD/TfdA family dioxygenase [Rhizobium laguerreae]|uniref:TauD/TfdA family dioxygenase n=1 Tax=Rhizobium laguerreae TaxID=1076926 RepID=UPI001FEBEDA9|nr:TauD/TfdA family dioxygenase [Rhizobium laguerreae]